MKSSAFRTSARDFKSSCAKPSWSSARKQHAMSNARNSGGRVIVCVLMARYGPLPRPVQYHLIFILLNNLAADDGVQNLGAENLVFRGSQNVLRENGDVGQFARLKRAFDIFFKSRIGVLNRTGAERLFTRHALFGTR